MQVPLVAPMKYNAEADKYLSELYRSAGAETWKQKFHTLEGALAIVPNTTSFSHKPTWRQKAGMLEYDVLENEGLINLVLA